MTRASEHPRVEIARTMRQIYELGLTTTSGGNLSIRTDDGRIWVTPARLDKGELRPEQVVPVDESGVATAGPTPSSELPFHRAIYSVRPYLRAIVHAHPISLVAFSITGQLPDTRVSLEAHTLCGEIGFAPYELPGSDRLGERIAAAFEQGFDCVVLENHGVVVGGDSLRHAFERFEALDLCARTILRARRLGGERPLTPVDLALAQRPESPHPSDIASRTPSRADPDREAELREALCSIVRRAHRRRLITSTQGFFSARLSSDLFLRTPADRPLDRLEPGDCTLEPIDGKAHDALERESSASLHAALYRAHPQVGAIAQGHPENASAFGLAGVPLPSRTIPESYIVIREPGRIAIALARTDPEAVAHVVCPDRPVALIEHGGAISLGSELLDAFDRLEVLEATAAAVLESSALGPFAPMDDARIEKLRETFFPDGGL